MIYKLPIICPPGYRPFVTQFYGEVGNVDWYKERGINIPFHNGIDIVLINTKTGIDDRKVTYGTALCSPGDGWKVVRRIYTSAVSSKGNGITLESPEFVEEGIKKRIQLLFWHCSSLENTPDVLVDGQVHSYIGNSGEVRPVPTPECVHCGAHLHFMMYEYHSLNGIWTLQNQDNGVGGAINPMLRIDFTKWYTGADTPVEKDLAPFSHFLEIIMQKIKEKFSL